MYIAVILSNANDIKISGVAHKILAPLLKSLKEQKEKKDQKKLSIEEAKHEDLMDVDEEATDGHVTSMFIKKASQYGITSIKAFQISKMLSTISFDVFELISNIDEQASLQGALETKILELFTKSFQSYTQDLQDVLNLLLVYIDYVYFKSTDLRMLAENQDNSSQNSSSNGSLTQLLINILQTTANLKERKVVFSI